MSGMAQLCASPVLAESESPKSRFCGCGSPINPGTCNRMRLVGRPDTLRVTTTGDAPLSPWNANVERSTKRWVACFNTTENKSPLPFFTFCPTAYKVFDVPDDGDTKWMEALVWGSRRVSVPAFCHVVMLTRVSTPSACETTPYVAEIGVRPKFMFLPPKDTFPMTLPDESYRTW